MHNINFQPHFSFRCDWHWLPGRPTSPNSQRATKQPNWRHRQRRRYAAAAAAAEVDRATSTTPMTLTTPTWWWCWAPPRSSAGCRRRPWIRRPSWWAAGRWRRIAGRWASTASTPRWPSPSRSGSGTPSCRVRKATGPTTSTMEATAGTMWTSYRHLIQSFSIVNIVIYSYGQTFWPKKLEFLLIFSLKMTFFTLIFFRIYYYIIFYFIYLLLNFTLYIIYSIFVIYSLLLNCIT